ncbi:DUF6036 family nucleotidyltransferase [Marinobacter subterrani]|uniref:DUF6036 domain-containing protein n=1 Tax=Marinobacter subterrani TaxID=1658765 RepID=A0A0J7J653_9GAMM|nr:DUF6036 family nucleotidyltransferase [Marinobacter subterrani]KMQ73436.1 hypothetical protein Msub_20636 [Marinobacter subterrani]
MTEIYRDTPMAKAIFEMFDNLADFLEDRGAKPGSCKAYIFGGCALHLHTNARGSSDLDIELEAMERISPNELVLALDEVFFDDPETGPSSIVFDPNFTPTLAPLHEDYQEDAIWLNRNEEDSPIWVYLVQKVDLAVSKLGRYGDQDIDDIHTLFDHGLSIEEFKYRAEEARKYFPGNLNRLTGNITHVIKTYTK